MEQNMASSFSSAQDVIRCSLCENTAEYYCKLCFVELSSDCIPKHLSDKTTKHEIVDFTNKIDSRESLECPTHEKNTCDIYCRDCEIPVCTKCLVGDHKLHDFAEVHDIIVEKRNALSEDISEFESVLIPAFQKKRNAIHDEKFKNTVELISNKEDAICNAVRDAGRKLKELVTQLRKENQENAEKNALHEQNILKAFQETKAMLLKNDLKEILKYRGISSDIRKHPKLLDTYPSLIGAETIPTQEISSLFGVLQFKNVDDDKDEISAGNLLSKPWFHGFIPPEEGERLLQREGDFLVREMWIDEDDDTYDATFFISIYQQSVLHIEIKPETVVEKVGPAGTIVEYVEMMQTSKDEMPLLHPIAWEKSQLDYDNILLGLEIESKAILEERETFFQGHYNSTPVLIRRFEDERKMFKNLEFLRKYEHPNIVRLTGYSALHKPVLLVIEHLSGGPLDTYLRKNESSISAKRRTEMCENVASAMDYLERKQCIIRDVATRNCLVSECELVKIYNFSMVEHGEGYEIKANTSTPIKWTAPEIFLSGHHNSLSDVWSFGILMWEIFSSGQTPYPTMENKKAVDIVTLGYRMRAPKDTPSKCYDLMMKCWEFEPNDRWHFDKIHKELQSIIKSMP